jgi:6-phosphogluconolactonase
VILKKRRGYNPPSFLENRNRMKRNDVTQVQSKIHIVRDTAALADAAAEVFCVCAGNSVSMQGRFTVALSGGATPRGMYRLLATEPYLSGIPWDVVHIFWVDERCVPVADAASNYGAARKDFLDHIPISPGNLHPMPGDREPRAGRVQYEEELIRFFNLKTGTVPQLDAIFLGMGKDGHTASLFPGQDSLHERTMLVEAVRGGRPSVDRLTLTLPVLNNAKDVVVLVSGREKGALVAKIVTRAPEYVGLPMGMVQPHRSGLLWIIDGAAASMIPEDVLSSTKTERGMRQGE